MTAESLVRVDDLKKTYYPKGREPIQAVRDVSFSMARGEILSLLGPNGAGKTSTIAMMSGLLPPSGGDVHIDGASIRNNTMDAKRRIGVVPQEIALYPTLTARRNLRFFGRMYNMHGKELERRIDEVLEFIELTDRRDERIDQFSGGMKRRVNIGAGLLHEPTLLFMDEPTVGVDPQSRRRILDTVLRLRREHGTTVLYTTHLMEEAQELSDRIGIIDHGQLIALGTHAELVQRIDSHARVDVMVSGPQVDEADVSPLRELGEIVVTHNDTDDGASLSVATSDPDAALVRIIHWARERALSVSSVDVDEPNMETVFLALTGRALRE